MNKYSRIEALIFALLLGIALGGVGSCIAINNYGNAPIEIVK